ncbi:MAG TPA: hypothetical protein VLE49_09520, partial [Anaerolineales bacterium]|nr:hypothetical protein [Anaerolineales bacterium]
GTQSGPATTLTCVPGRFVRSQFSRIPGEERKFKRRRIVAFVPTCKREREVAISQTSAAEVPGLGVGVVSGAGVAIGEGTGVGLGSEVSVSVGETIAVDGGDVEEGRGVAVGADMFVPVGGGVAVDGGDVDETGLTVGPVPGEGV